MLRAIIIDDEQKAIDALRIVIESHCEQVKVVAESTDPVRGINLIEDYAPDIVFLDISMPEKDGFEMLEDLRWKDFNLIFCTAHREYGVRAIRNNAVDYLLKPVDPEELRATVERILQKSKPAQPIDPNAIDIQSPNKLIVSTKNGIEPVDAGDIVFLESFSNYTTIHMTGGRRIHSSKTLKEYEKALADHDNFLRVHNSFVVNLHKVIRYHRGTETITTSEGNSIPVSKSRKDVFMRWLAE